MLQGSVHITRMMPAHSALTQALAPSTVSNEILAEPGYRMQNTSWKVGWV